MTAATRPAGRSAARTTSLPPARDGRLVPYGLVGLGGLAGAVVFGQAWMAALATPFVVALALGLRRTGPVDVTARMVVDSDQVLEGDLIRGRLELEWDGPLDARLVVERLRGVAPASPDGASLVGAMVTSLELPVRMRATRWGRHALGEVWLRLEAPFGLVSWTGRVLVGPAVRVMPDRERLDRLLHPRESRAVWGMHPSRRLGQGHEFAELRPYAPGDRLRDLNWRATARHGRPFVNRYHPELAGDVLIAIDAFDDGSRAAEEGLARAARAAWALASFHLGANDRVGLVGLGGGTRWLPPAGGRLARYQLVETLLEIGGEAADGVAGRGTRSGVPVPAAALVIVLTPLHAERTVGAVQAWRARGRSVVVVLVDTDELLGESGSTAEALARRVWRIERDARSRKLSEIGVPVVRARVRGPMTPVISALRRARRAPSFRRPG